MISRNDNGTLLPEQGQTMVCIARIRIGIIGNTESGDISQTDQLVDTMLVNLLQDPFKRLNILMNIRYGGNTQGLVI